MIAGIIDNDTGNLPFEKMTDRKLAVNEDRPQIDIQYLVELLNGKLV
jgi:hypothetical protein